MGSPEKRVGFFSLSAYFFVLCVSIAAACCALALFLIPAPAARPAGRVPWALVVTSGLMVSSLLWGRSLHRGLGRPFLLFQGAIAALLLAALGTVETLARFRLPAWPARDLHGEKRSGSGINSWGQKDRERSVVPEAGVSRVALVGGVYLDDPSPSSLSRLLDERVGAPYEFVNLGVRGQTLREAYWRVRDLAVPLGSERVFLFFDPVRDLVYPSGADTRLAPHLARLALDRPPRGSLAGLLFPGLTQLLLPVARADLSPTDRDWSAHLRRTGTEELPSVLARLAGPKGSALTRLGREPLTSLRRVMQRPDGGALDPNFLKRLLLAIAEPDAAWNEATVEATARWILGSARAARQNRLALTVVWIPPPEIDERIRDQWIAVGDLRPSVKRWSSLLEQLREMMGDRVDVLDLTPDLSATRGSYLSGTGLWSPAALERVAARVGDRVSAAPVKPLP